MRAYLIIACAACGLAGLLGAAIVTAGGQIPPTETITVAIPVGDPVAGREAFVTLRCGTCHAVVGDPAFPEPMAELAGPAIDAVVGARDLGQLATSIVSPSHLIGLDVSEAVKERVEFGFLSPMGDFSEVLTLRQLADLLAFVRAERPGS